MEHFAGGGTNIKSNSTFFVGISFIVLTGLYGHVSSVAAYADGEAHGQRAAYVGIVDQITSTDTDVAFSEGKKKDPVILTPFLKLASYQAFSNWNVQIPKTGICSYKETRDRHGRLAGIKYTLKYGDEKTVWRTLIGNKNISAGHILTQEEQGFYSVGDLDRREILPICITLYDDAGRTLEVIPVDGDDHLQNKGINLDAGLTEGGVRQVLNQK